MRRWTMIRFWFVVILLAFIYIVLQFGVDLYTDWLWFDQLSLASVFTTSLWAKVAAALAAAVPFALIFLINLLAARWQSVRNVLFFSEDTLVAQKFVVWMIWAAGLFVAWIVGSAAASNWLLFLRFLYRQPFGLTEPVFNQDVGFYMFSLPFYHFVQTWLVIVLFLSLIGMLLIYILAQQNNLTLGRFTLLPYAQLHLSIVGALIFFALAWGHRLAMFDLMYSPRGVAFGASYTDINITLPALWVMLGVALISGLILLLNTLLRRRALSLLAVFIWIVAGVIGVGVIPSVVQRYIVEPNELARETPYIETNIHLTQVAYGLDKIQQHDFANVAPLTPQMLENDQPTLKNVRLWDYRPLLQTYQQIQAIRLYYHFYDVDLDRYVVNGELRQVALAARELDKSQLQSPTWVTQKLQFTHGYGVVVNPINEVTGEGLPLLWVKDLPPKSSVDLNVSRSEIYYGEAPEDYVFVKTSEREFDYPSGDQNVYASYQGTSGVVLDNSLKRLAFALRLTDMNMLLSQEFTNDSRVMLYRNIQDRVHQIAPFLEYDHDPYVVIGPDGHLYWLQDAYTTSNYFPYSEPSGSFNYIRNSVKVLIDAYEGKPTFYLIDPSDPLAATYAAIFPNLFTPASQMPEWVKAHLRYPEDLFRIQSKLYQTYHMRDVNVFYNKEDLWQTPMETFMGQTQPVEPYYVIMRLPGQTDSEFALIQPFTPNNKDNLIAWMAARSDGEHYGELVAYQFPKQELIFGPLQIEGRIDQNPDISAQITLWDQGGSQVIRGNMLVLPIGNSLLYVEPLYLQAERGQIPELKRVILASGDQIVMRPTLAESLSALLTGEGAVAAAGAEAPATAGQPGATPEATPAAPGTPAPLSDNVSELARAASAHYDAAQAALRNGDWATYGDELAKMKAALDKLIELTQAK